MKRAYGFCRGSKVVTCMLERRRSLNTNLVPNTIRLLLCGKHRVHIYKGPWKDNRASKWGINSFRLQLASKGTHWRAFIHDMSLQWITFCPRTSETTQCVAANTNYLFSASRWSGKSVINIWMTSKFWIGASVVTLLLLNRKLCHAKIILSAADNLQ